MKRWAILLIGAALLLCSAAAADSNCFYDDAEQGSATCSFSFDASVYHCSKNGDITLAVLNVTSHMPSNYFNGSRSHIESANITFGLIPEKDILSSSGKYAESKLFLFNSPTPPFTASLTYTTDLSSIGNKKEFPDLQVVDGKCEISVAATQAVFNVGTKQISVSGNISGVSGSTNIIYALINQTDRTVVESVKSAFEKSFEHTFSKQFSPKDIVKLKTAIIVWQDAPFALGVATPEFASFSDYVVEVTAPEQISPLTKFDLGVKITNFANEQDTYSIKVEAPTGWQSAAVPETQIKAGESQELKVQVAPSRDFKGPQKLRVVTTSQKSPVNHTEEIVLQPEKKFTLKAEIYPYPRPTPTTPFNVTLFFNSTGTIDDTVKYSVFTIPYVKTTGIDRSITVTPGIKLFRESDTILDACALDEDDSLKARMLYELKLIASLLGEELLAEDPVRIDELAGMQNSRIIAIRDLPVSETIASTSLDIKDFAVELTKSGEDAVPRNYIDKRKSELLQDLDYQRSEIRAALSSLFTDEDGNPACRLTSSLNYWVIGMTKSDFTFFNSTRQVQLTSSKRILLDIKDEYGRSVGYSTIQAGEYKQFKLYITNTFNETKDFKIRASESVLELDVTDEMTIDAGKADFGMVSISVPSQLPEGNYPIDISVSTDPYTENFPLVVEVSRLGVSISARSKYEFGPGVTNVTIRVINKGTGNDTYFLSLEGEGWLKVPPQVSLAGGEEADVPLTLSRSKSIEESTPYEFTLNVKSASSENVEESSSFEVVVTSTSPAEYLDRLEKIKSDYNALRAACPDYDASSIKTDIDESTKYINEGRGSAEVYLQSAENDLAYGKKQCAPKGIDTGLVTIVVLLAAIGIGAYYYYTNIAGKTKKDDMEDYAKKYIEDESKKAK